MYFFHDMRAYMTMSVFSRNYANNLHEESRFTSFRPYYRVYTRDFNCKSSLFLSSIKVIRRKYGDVLVDCSCISVCRRSIMLPKGKFVILDRNYCVWHYATALWLKRECSFLLKFFMKSIIPSSFFFCASLSFTFSL